MQVFDVIYLVVLVCLCIVTIRTDLKEGMVYNKTLKKFTVIAVILNLIYYMGFHIDLIDLFACNMLIIIVISLGLFFSHSFAGGDCKLAIVLALFVPAQFYIVINGSGLTLFWTIGFAIFFGYIYILVMAIQDIVKGKNKLTFEHVKKSIVNFLKSFFSVMIYIVCINYIDILLYSVGIEINVWVTRILCIAVSLVIGKYPNLKKKSLMILVLAVDFVLGILTKIFPLSINPENYLLVVILLIFQIIITTDLYEEIEAENIKKGMILSTGNSILMQNSRVRGLPGISTESLKDRLTDDETESIKRWAKAKEIQTLIVVKKIPFAVFLALGYVSYIFLWGILR